MIKSAPSESHNTIDIDGMQFTVSKNFSVNNLRETAKDILNLRKAQEGSFKHFCEYCFVDEETGNPWEIQPFQEEWINLSDNNDRLLLFAPVSHTKSSLFNLAYPLWLLGNNPNLRILTVSDTATQASEFLLSGSSHIITNERLKKVFPHLKPEPHHTIPSRPLRWTDQAIIVSRDRSIRHASWKAIGSGGPILGGRVDIAILDDCVDFENSISKSLKDKLIKWFDSTLLGRLTEKAKVIVVGTAWIDDDLYHILERRTGWKSVRYSCEPEDVKDGFKLARWKNREGWYDKKRSDLTPAEYDRQLRCRTRASDDVSFPSVSKCLRFLPTDSIKELRSMIKQLTPRDSFIRSGVDLSSPKRPGNAIVTTAESKSIEDTTKIVIDIRYGAWTSPQTASQIDQVSHDFGVDHWIVENNAYQGALKEWMRHDNYEANIKPFVTGRNKADPDLGLPALESQFNSESWIIPLPEHTKLTVSPSISTDCECHWCRFAKELTKHPNYSTTDGVMALWFSAGIRKGSEPSITVLDSQGNPVASKYTTEDYRLNNRISLRRNFTPPDQAQDIVDYFRAMRLSANSAKSFLSKIKSDQVTSPFNKEDSILILEEMIHYCEVLSK